EVTVEVQDANDNAPLFNLSAIAASTNTGSAFETVVAEDSPVGAVVARFVADDPDVGNNGSVSFSLADSGGAFEIDATDGTLRTASRGLLDRELAAEHRLLVRATDAGRPQRVSELRFLVRILDRNDCTPTFVTVDGGQGHGRLTLMVDEATPPGALLTRLIAVDSDEGLNGRVHYRLIGAPEATAQFWLDSRSGCLFLAAPLRRPATRSLFVEAIDSGVGREGSRSSRILLLAHSAAPPPRVPIFVVFDRPVLALTVSEAAAVGTPVGRLSVSLTPRHSEFKARQRLLFSLVDGNGLGFFGVRDDGTLVTLQPLDREAQPSGYWLTVRAQLGAVAAAASGARASPRAASLSASGTSMTTGRECSRALHRRLTVMEGAPAGRELLAEIPAEDSDDPAVVATLGTRQVARELSWTIGQGGTLSRRPGTLSWTIGQEVAGRGHFVMDNRTVAGHLSWTIGQVVAGHFVMDRAIGQVVAGHFVMDNRTGSGGHFVMDKTVSDSGQPQPLTATPLIEVTVQDLNDSPPRFLQRIFDVWAYPAAAGNTSETEIDDPPTIPPEDPCSLSNVSVAQSRAFAGATRLAAVDPDIPEQAVTEYRILPDDILGSNLSGKRPAAAAAAAWPELGKLPSMSTFVVSAVDARSGAEVSALVRGRRCCLCQRQPKAPRPEMFNIFAAANGSQMWTVVSADATLGSAVQSAIVVAEPDSAACSGRVLFSLSGSGSEDFLSAAGWRPPGGGATAWSPAGVRPAGHRNHTGGGNCSISERMRLRAFTTGFEFLLQSLSVRIIPANRHSPRFSQPSYSVSVQLPDSSSSEPVEVIVLGAEDADPGPGRLQFSLAAPQETSGCFQLEPLTGRLLLLPSGEPPCGRHRLAVRVVDSFAADRRHGLAEVTVDVRCDRLNRHRPVIVGIEAANGDEVRQVGDEGLVDVSVDGTAPVGRLVARIRAYDLDEGDGGRLRFFIESGNELSQFSIDAVTGHVTVSRGWSDPRAPRPAIQLLRLGVSDYGSPVLTGQPWQLRVRAAEVSPAATAPRGRRTATVQILEEAPAGSFVAKLDVPADTSAGGLVIEEVSDGGQGLFDIAESSGVVYLRRPIDRESHGDFFRLVVAAQSSTAANRQTFEVFVSVLDINDNAPRFRHAGVLDGEVVEGAPAGTAVLNSATGAPMLLVAEDADEGANAALTFEIEPAEAAEDFEVDSIRLSSGVTNPLLIPCSVLRTADKLDYETAKVHHLVVRATDPTSGTYSEVPVTVRVLDENDESPKFTAASLEVTVSELEDPRLRRPLLTASAADPDTGDGGRVTFAIEPDSDSGENSSSSADLFEVDSTTGVLRLRQKLDREAAALHRLRLVARDSHPTSPRSSLVPLTVRVADFNDNPPRFRRGDNLTRLFRINADLPPGSFVAKVTALDADSAEQPALRYWLAPDFGARQFRMDERRGVLRYRPRGAAVGRYNLVAMVTDSVHWDRLELTVEILPSATGGFERPLRCARRLFHARVEENRPAGQQLLQIQVDNQDQLDVDFQLLNDRASSTFSLNSSSGWLATKGVLDREVSSGFGFEVRVADLAGRRYADCSVQIDIAGVNDNRPGFEFADEEVAIAAGAPVGTEVFRARATDRDDPMRPVDDYRLDEVLPEESRKFFAVNASTGVVTIATAVDSFSEHRLTIVARDWQPPHLEARLRLTVLALPPTSPRLNVACRPVLGVDAKPRPLADCRATLGDQPFVDFVADLAEFSPASPPTWRPATAAALTVQGDRLLLTATPLLSPERLFRGALQLAVTVRAAGLRPPRNIVYFGSIKEGRHLQTIRRRLSLPVDGLPSPLPVFEAVEYRVRLSEAAPPGTSVVRVRADGSDFVAYSIEPAVEFRIDSSTGHVTSAAPLDREAQPTHRLTLRAADAATGAIGPSASLVVDLVDVNDEPPRWLGAAEASSSVSEAAPVGTEVARLRLSDADVASADAAVRFHFVDAANDTDDPSEWFDILPDGRLVLAGPLDREARPVFELLILASDGRFTTHKPFRQRVVVTDVNDNPPRCRSDSLLVDVSEAAPLNATVAWVAAEDADDPASGFGRLVFKIVESDAGAIGKFGVDSDSGRVALTGRLDREIRDRHELTVAASDGEFSCRTRLTVRVIDFNDCPPVFTAWELRPVPEDLPAGSLIGKVHAEDCDIGQAGRT
uniref:Cadherin domain-containing protein n=1 Tax=Macrostomum lignano TaxID=282301 RepID=A0A1I8IT02_9PLAT